jgi:alcohol dehydrogenase class IV
MQRPFDNNLPRRLRFGRGASAGLAEELRRLGCSRPFFITDAGVRAAGLVARVTDALGGEALRHRVFDGTEAEPPFACVAAAVSSVRGTFDADVVVALGGGSVMDTAKLVAATLLDGRDAPGLAGIGKVGRRQLPLVCLPTTAGTGSEATPVAIFTDPATGTKVGVVDPCLVPDLVLLDPELTDGLAAAADGGGGHGRPRPRPGGLHRPDGDPACPRARPRGGPLDRPRAPAVCRDGGTVPRATQMLLGANLAGLAFANSSCCGVHALALPLGGRFHIAHGVVTGCLAAETMRTTCPRARGDFAAFADALGWNLGDPDPSPTRSRPGASPSASRGCCEPRPSRAGPP